jgi:2'-5' RNA ligase
VLRAFVALEVPVQVIDALVDFQRSLSETGADLKLVERQNLHFTVKFLGEIFESQVAEAKSRLSGTTATGAHVEVKGAGAFPTVTNPRVVWVGVSHDDELKVSKIAGEVSRSLDGIGLKDDRPYRAHITLARVRSLRNSRQLGELLREASSRQFGDAKLSQLKLKSSVLTSSGPIYQDIGVFLLR